MLKHSENGYEYEYIPHYLVGMTMRQNFGTRWIWRWECGWHFFYGDGYEIAKPIPVPPSCHPYFLSFSYYFDS